MQKNEDYNLGEREIEKVRSAIATLAPLAQKEGCTVSELVEKFAGGEDEDSEIDAGVDADAPSGDQKVSAIVARLKSKMGSGEES